MTGCVYGPFLPRPPVTLPAERGKREPGPSTLAVSSMRETAGAIKRERFYSASKDCHSGTVRRSTLPAQSAEHWSVSCRIEDGSC